MATEDLRQTVGQTGHRRSEAICVPTTAYWSPPFAHHYYKATCTNLVATEQMHYANQTLRKGARYRSSYMNYIGAHGAAVHAPMSIVLAAVAGSSVCLCTADADRTSMHNQNLV